MDNQQRGPASPARGIFSAANRAFLMEQAIGKPTGIIVELGGLEFNLVPLSTRDGKRVIAMAEELTETWKGIAGGNVTQADVFATLGSKLPEVLDMVKRVLADSAGIADDDARALFEEWFEATPFVPTLKALIPKVLRANGMDAIADRIERPSTPASQTTETPAPQAQPQSD